MRASRLQIIIIFLVSILSSAALYSYSLQGQFIRDDKIYSYREDLHHAKTLLTAWKQPYTPGNKSIGVYRPLTLVSFTLNFTIFGKSTLSFHIFNILINGINVFLVWLILCKLFKNKLFASIGASIFALMPVHTEAVAFIKSRDELLAAMFGFLAWFVFIKAVSVKNKTFSYKWMIFSSILFALSVLSKETLFSIPAMFIAVYWVMEKPKFKEIFKISMVFLIPALLYFVVRFLVLGKYAFGSDVASFVIDPLSSANLATRVFTAFKIAFLLFSKTIIPWSLTATYNFNHLKLVHNLFTDWQAIAGLILLGTLTWLCFTKRKSLQVLRVGSIALIIPYLMVSKLIFGAGEITGERWMYFPSIGIVIIMAFLLTKLLDRSFWLWGTTVTLIFVSYGFITVHRNIAWINERTLGESEVEASPESAVSYLTLSDWYFDVRDYGGAKAQLLKALSIAPTYPNTLDSLGRIAYFDGDYPAAANYYYESLKNGGVAVGVYLTFCQILEETGYYKDSIKLAGLLHEKFPKQPDVEFILALDYYKLGQVSEAKKHLNWDGSKIVGNAKLSEEDKLTLLGAIQ